MTIDGVIYYRGASNGINTVKSYNRFASANSKTIVAGTTPARLNQPEVIDMLSSNAVATATGDWIPISDRATADGYYFIEGNGGSAAFTLQYRPDSSYTGYMVAAAYSGANSNSVIQTFEILNGEYRSVNASGAGINAMPQILIQEEKY